MNEGERTRGEEDTKTWHDTLVLTMISTARLCVDNNIKLIAEFTLPHAVAWCVNCNVVVIVTRVNKIKPQNYLQIYYSQSHHHHHYERPSLHIHLKSTLRWKFTLVAALISVVRHFGLPKVENVKIMRAIQRFGFGFLYSALSFLNKQLFWVDKHPTSLNDVPRDNLMRRCQSKSKRDSTS